MHRFKILIKKLFGFYLVLFHFTHGLNSTYYLIPTKEGLAVNLISLNHVYTQVVKTYSKVLVLVPFTSDHYKDSGWIRLCEYFELPEGIVCTSEYPVDVVSRIPCTVDCSNNVWPCHKDEKIFLNINFDLELRSTEFPLITKAKYNFEKDVCGLYVSEDFSRKADWFRIVPKKKYVGIFQLIRQILYFHSGMSSSSTLGYTVLHWRRGDQLSERCVNGIDSSLNCMNSTDVVKYVNNMKLLDKNVTSFLYLATNERNKTVLEFLHDQGVYSWWTFYKKYNFNLRSIEMFILELQLMLDASRFLRPRANFGWFSFASWIDQLIEIEREKLGKKSEVIDYP